MPERFFEQPATEDIVLAEIMHALGEPVRLQIVAVLADGRYHPCRAEEFGIDLHKSTLTHHFKVLRQAGVTQTRIEGRDHSVRLRRTDLESRFPGLLRSLTRALTATEALVRT
jgi:DNA-binding transcriptional ArsR family regulator